MIKHLKWNNNGGTVIVEEGWWNYSGGTLKVEQ